MNKGVLPHLVSGRVVKGFGRGSKDLGVPTANLDSEAVEGLPVGLREGVYAGWARLPGTPVHAMVASLGYNPFYGNEVRSLEVHLVNYSGQNFYGETIQVCLLKLLRGQVKFSSVEELVRAIDGDIEDAKRLLQVPEMAAYKEHPFFSSGTHASRTDFV